MPEKYKLTEEDLQSLMGEDLVVHSKGLPTKETMSHLDKLASGSDQVLTKSEYEKQWHKKSYEWARLAYFDSHYSKGEPSGPFVMEGWVIDNQDVTKSLATAYAPDILSNTSGRVPEEEKVAYRKKLAKKFITPLHLYTKSLDKLIKSTTDSKTQFEDQIDALSSMIYYLDLAISNLESDIHDSEDNANDVAQLNHSYNNQAFLYLNRYHPGYFGFSAEHTLQKLKKIREKLVSFQEKNPALNNEAIQAHSSIYQRGGAYEKIAEAGDQYHATYFSRNKNTQPQPIDKNTAQKNIYRFIIEMLEGKIPYDESHLRQNALIAIYNHHDLIITSIKRSPANDIMTARTNLLNLTHFLDMLQSLNKAGLTEHTQANLGSFVLPVNSLVSKYPDPAIAALKAKINRIIDPPNVLPLQSTSSVSSPTSSSSSSEDAQSVKIEQAIASMDAGIEEIAKKLRGKKIHFIHPDEPNSAFSFEIFSKTTIGELPNEEGFRAIKSEMDVISQTFKTATTGMANNPELLEAKSRLSHFQTAVTGIEAEIKEKKLNIRNKLRDQKGAETAADAQAKSTGNFDKILLDIKNRALKAHQEIRDAEAINNPANRGRALLEKRNDKKKESVKSEDDIKFMLDDQLNGIIESTHNARKIYGIEPELGLRAEIAEIELSLETGGEFNNVQNSKRKIASAKKLIDASDEIARKAFETSSEVMTDRKIIADRISKTALWIKNISNGIDNEECGDVGAAISHADDFSNLSDEEKIKILNSNDFPKMIQCLRAAISLSVIVRNDLRIESSGVSRIILDAKKDAIGVMDLCIKKEITALYKFFHAIIQHAETLGNIDSDSDLDACREFADHASVAIGEIISDDSENPLFIAYRIYQDAVVAVNGLQIAIENEASHRKNDENDLETMSAVSSQSSLGYNDNEGRESHAKFKSVPAGSLGIDRSMTDMQVITESIELILTTFRDGFKSDNDKQATIDIARSGISLQFAKFATLLDPSNKNNDAEYVDAYNALKDIFVSADELLNTAQQQLNSLNARLAAEKAVASLDKIVKDLDEKSSIGSADIYDARRDFNMANENFKMQSTDNIDEETKMLINNISARFSVFGERLEDMLRDANANEAASLGQGEETPLPASLVNNNESIPDILAQAKQLYNSVKPKDPKQISLLFDMGTNVLVTLAEKAANAMTGELKLIKQLQSMKKEQNARDIEMAVDTINRYINGDIQELGANLGQHGLLPAMKKSNAEIQARLEIRKRLDAILKTGLDAHAIALGSIAFANNTNSPSHADREKHVALLTEGIQEIDKQMGLVRSISKEPDMRAMSHAVHVPSGSRDKIGVIDLSFDILEILGKYRDEQRRALVLINSKYVVNSIPKAEALTSMHSTEIQKFIDQLTQAKKSIPNLLGTSEIDQLSGYVSLQANLLNAEQTLVGALAVAEKRERIPGSGKRMSAGKTAPGTAGSDDDDNDDARSDGIKMELVTQPDEDDSYQRLDDTPEDGTDFGFDGIAAALESASGDASVDDQNNDEDISSLIDEFEKLTFDDKEPNNTDSSSENSGSAIVPIPINAGIAVVKEDKKHAATRIPWKRSERSNKNKTLKIRKNEDADFTVKDVGSIDASPKSKNKNAGKARKKANLAQLSMQQIIQPAEIKRRKSSDADLTVFDEKSSLMSAVKVSTPDRQVIEANNIQTMLDKGGKGAREIYRLNIDALMYIYTELSSQERKDIYAQIINQKGHIHILGKNGQKYSLLLAEPIALSNTALLIDPVDLSKPDEDILNELHEQVNLYLGNKADAKKIEQPDQVKQFGSMARYDNLRQAIEKGEIVTKENTVVTSVVVSELSILERIRSGLFQRTTALKHERYVMDVFGDTDQVPEMLEDEVSKAETQYARVNSTSPMLQSGQTSKIKDRVAVLEHKQNVKYGDDASVSQDRFKLTKKGLSKADFVEKWREVEPLKIQLQDNHGEIKDYIIIAQIYTDKQTGKNLIGFYKRDVTEELRANKDYLKKLKAEDRVYDRVKDSAINDADRKAYASRYGSHENGLGNLVKDYITEDMVMKKLQAPCIVRTEDFKGEAELARGARIIPKPKS